MPKKNTKAHGKSKKAGANTVEADDDFDVMLAELRATDLITAARASTSSSGSSSLSAPTARVASGMSVPPCRAQVPLLQQGQESIWTLRR
jgi:hypothetical protein